MANQPQDVRWPPSNNIDFDDILDVMFQLRSLHFPEHTAKDLIDPFVQQMVLTTALGSHVFNRANHALKQFDVRSISARRAMIALLAHMNRPLLPMQPSRGKVYGKLSGAPVINTTYLVEGMRFAQAGITDPSYSADEDIATGGSVAFDAWFYDTSADTATQQVFTAAGISMEENDAIIIGFPGLMFNAVDLAFNSNPAASGSISWEYFNIESGSPSSVTEVSGTLEFDLSDYLNDASDSAYGLEVSITHKPTNVTEVVTVTSTSAPATAVTSYLGQATPSTSISDYEVIADWRPIPSVVDGTTDMTGDGTVSFLITDLKSETNDWAEHDEYGWAIRGRICDPAGTAVFPELIDLEQPTNTDGSWYAEVMITQGYRRQVTAGQTDGTKFQFISVSLEPIDEPVSDPKVEVTIDTDTDWEIVDDFTATTASSKHGIFSEDVDDGWGVIFGDGTVGQLPTNGEPVYVTFRSGSTQPGDLADGSEVKALGGPGLVSSFVLPRGTEGYMQKECSDYDSTQRFRFNIVPQLALRAESVISAPEVTTALSGGAPNRATFTTSDGRKPFSRAFYTLEGAGTRQYRVLVVGSENDPLGTVSSADAAEAEVWLNGTEVGIEVVGGHGPQNTEAIVSAFVSRSLLPTITVYVPSSENVRAQAEQVIRTFFSPHSRDENGTFRWSFGGKVPMAVLFGLLWNAIPNRTFIEISTSDGVDTYDAGDFVQLGTYELPVLDSTFDPDTNIIIVLP
jgi:hypothetical protein